jgi:probable DNA metabolism protein
MKAILRYDGTFEGLLTGVFECYERRLKEVTFTKGDQASLNIFGSVTSIVSDNAKALRVWTGLSKKVSVETTHNVYACFLSEIEGIEATIVEYLRYIFASPLNVERDYSHPGALSIAQISRKVFRETHRMEAFIRFKRLKDDLYFAEIEPDYNVLPLIVNHFKDRYADQRWMIYDLRRNYGLTYDPTLSEVNEVRFIEHSQSILNDREVLHTEELSFQELWKKYYSSVNIQLRKNTKLHVQHVPVRYWKHLIEKQPGA